ncbi:MAG: Holliday junction resolvase RuvX [Rhizobiales bacterium]|nr:Holliday junction resolvase RuvX [Hyphomicrobiales bacterium]
MKKPDPTLEDFKAALPPTGALLGLDLGTKTIGLALSDIRRSIASPLLVIRRTKFQADLVVLKREVERHAVVGLVLGLPVNMDGSEGPRVQATRGFARNMASTLPLPLVFWDERLSTAAVTRTLIEADASRKRRGEVVDKVAAAYILQGALDRLARLET